MIFYILQSKKFNFMFTLRPGSVWNCLWGHALIRSLGINRKSRELHPGPEFLSSAT